MQRRAGQGSDLLHGSIECIPVPAWVTQAFKRVIFGLGSTNPYESIDCATPTEDLVKKMH